jgi:hypothetical protein
LKADGKVVLVTKLPKLKRNRKKSTPLNFFYNIKELLKILDYFPLVGFSFQDTGPLVRVFENLKYPEPKTSPKKLLKMSCQEL